MNRRQWLKRAGGGLLAFGAAQTAGALQAKDRPNVIWIILDAARAANFQPYGYARKTCPAITGLAGQGVLFEKAFTQAFWTSPSVSSYMTGKYFPQWITPCLDTADSFLLEASGAPPIAPALFAAQGYATVMLSSNRAYVLPESRLGRHFEVAQFTPMADWPLLRGQGSIRKDTFREVAATFIPWLRGRKKDKRPFFAYLHAMDTHAPFVIPNEPPYNTWLVDDYDGKWIRRFQPRLDPRGNQTARPEDRQQLLGLYDGAIRHSDHYISHVLEELEALGLADSTFVVVTSDHGEALLEDGRNWGHSGTLGRAGPDETYHVPLLMRGPGLPKGRRVGTLVESVDILPTLLELCGVPPHPDIDGKSLRRVIDEPDAAGPHPYVMAKLSSHDLHSGGKANLKDTAQLYLRNTRFNIQYDRGAAKNCNVFHAPDRGGQRVQLPKAEAAGVLQDARDFFDTQMKPLEDLAQSRIPARAVVASLGNHYLFKEPSGHLARVSPDTQSPSAQQREKWMIDRGERGGPAFVFTPAMKGETCRFNILRVVYGQYKVLVEAFQGKDRWGLEAGGFEVAFYDKSFVPVEMPASGGNTGWQWLSAGTVDITRHGFALRLRSTGEAARLRRLVLYNDVPGAKRKLREWILGDGEPRDGQQKRTEALEALGYL